MLKGFRMCTACDIPLSLHPPFSSRKTPPKFSLMGGINIIMFTDVNMTFWIFWKLQLFCVCCNKNTLEKNLSSLVGLLTLHFHFIASYLMWTGAWSPAASQHCSCRQLRLHHWFCWLNCNIAVLCDHLMRVTFMNPHYAFFRDHEGYSTFIQSLFCHWWSRLCIPVLGLPSKHRSMHFIWLHKPVIMNHNRRIKSGKLCQVQMRPNSNV